MIRQTKNCTKYTLLYNCNIEDANQTHNFYIKNIGGITGNVADVLVIAKNIYNIGNITVYSNIDFQILIREGGLIGYNQGQIINGYNAGKIVVNGENGLVGEIAGEVRQDNIKVSNMYYLRNNPFGKSQLTSNEAVLVTEEELKNLEVTLYVTFYN